MGRVRTISFSVHTARDKKGRLMDPGTKGSSRGFPIKRKFGKIGVVITNDNPKNKAWAKLVADAAMEAKGSSALWTSAVDLALLFWVRRPAKIPAGRGTLPTVRPDIDKMARSVIDALTGVAYKDDSQIVTLTVRKEYGDQPGVMVELTGGGGQ